MGDLDNSPKIQITGTIMVIAIIVLFLVVVFVIFLHLYAKWFWWQIEEPTPPPSAATRRRHHRRPLVFAPGQEIPLRSGLDITVLRSLPVVMMQYKDFTEGLECAVCLCEIEEGEKARLLPKCNHGFHVDCIDMWFTSHSTCPICRSKVGPLLPSTNGGSTSSSVDHDRDDSAEGNGQPLEEVLASGYPMESASFPTNVLVWGDETQVSTYIGGGGEGTSGQLPSRSSSLRASSSTSLEVIRRDEILVIDIPDPIGEDLAEDQESDKSAEPRRLRSFRRILSRERRVAPSGSSSYNEV